VVFGIYMITVAIKTNDGLVVDDYYKKGKEINLVLDRDVRATELGLSAEIVLDMEKQLVRVRLGGRQLPGANETVSLNFLNATRAGMDRKMLLSPAPGGELVGQLLPLEEGVWNIELGSRSWRLTGRYKTPGDSQIQLLAERQQ